MTAAARMDVRRGDARLVTRTDWLTSRHSFSFGRHYQADNTAFGLLLVNNDDVIAPGMGFSTHPHRDIEILTWVVEGELAHRDDQGNTGVITPGMAQRISAGTGILHSEGNAREDAPLRFVQMWVQPDTTSVVPSYAQRDVSGLLARSGWVAVASGRADHEPAIAIRQRDATLWAARLTSGERLRLPEARHVHLFLARGSGTLEGVGGLFEGDAVRLTAAGAPTFTAGEHAELLVWEMHQRH